MKTFFTGKFAAFFLLFFSGLLSFSATQARADEGDPPTRVGRISAIDGSVSIQPGGTGDWGSAVRNRPVTVGDKLWSDRDSRVELQAGQASIHLGSDTALSFLNLDQGITQMRLSEGHLNFRVRELREGDLYEVDTPNLAFTVRQAGAFRVDVNENGDYTGVTVIRGEGEVTAGGNTYPVRSGESAELNGIDQVEYHVARAPGPDDLDRWASQRDLKEDNAVSARYVSRDMAGYDDLDDYGDWRDVPEYGHVWYPRSVEPGWAPYSTGYWNWVGPWGWTWVDEEPWGFAPYHYGRWSYIGGGWGWCPGPIYAEPIYGPAFVGFLGGGGLSIGIGFGGGFGYGGVGWFPLGFGEPYQPWYGYSGNYLRNVNISNTYINNTTIINNTTVNNYNYAYAHNVNAVTTTTHNNFISGQPINRGEAHLTAASLRGAQVTNKIAAMPTKASYFGGANVGRKVAAPPSSVINRPVVARTAPAAAASHMPVHTVAASTLTPGREANRNLPTNSVVGRPTNGSNSATNSRGAASNPSFTGRAPVMQQSQSAPATARQRESNSNRPPSSTTSPTRSGSTYNRPTSNVAPARTSPMQDRPGDRGRPSGISNAAPTSRPTSTNTNRPPWAGTARSEAGPTNGNRSYNPSTPNYGNGSRGNGSYSAPQRPSSGNSRPPASNNNRSYAPSQTGRGYSAPPQSYSAPSRGYSAPTRNYPAPRSYSPPARNDSRSYSAPNRGYSAPSQNYSAPSRGYSAPARSYSAPAPSHSYSAPARSYSAPAPSRSYSAPAAPHNSGNGGGGSRGGNINQGRR